MSTGLMCLICRHYVTQEDWGCKCARPQPSLDGKTLSREHDDAARATPAPAVGDGAAVPPRADRHAAPTGGWTYCPHCLNAANGPLACCDRYMESPDITEAQAKAARADRLAAQGDRHE